MALAVSGASSENWGAGGVQAPEPLDAPPDARATGRRLLRCYDSRGGGLGREDTPFLLSLLLWAPVETLKRKKNTVFRSREKWLEAFESLKEMHCFTLFNALLSVWHSGLFPPPPPRPAPLEAVILFKEAEEAGGRDFLKVLLINTLAQTYARHTNYKH